MAMQLRQKNKSHTSRFYKTVTDYSVSIKVFSLRGLQGLRSQENYVQQQVLLCWRLDHDTHLRHAGIYIQARALLHIGPDHHERVKMFIFLSPRKSRALRLLLLIDLVVVCLEIFFLYRALPPS